MRTPADFFRRYQKVLLPVITGLAIFAFLVSDATNGNVQNMGPVLVIMTAAVLCGGAAWIAGIGKDKGSEYGLFGVIVGVLLGLVINNYRKEGPTLTQAEQMRARKEIYVANAVASRRGQQADLVRYLVENPNSRHLLLDDARKLGIHLSDDVGGWTMKNAGMTRVEYDSLKKNLQVTDSLITTALRNDAEATLVARNLYGDGMVLASPADWWSAYKKLNLRQSALVAGLPVDQFIDPKLEPKEADLLTLFEEYKRNSPGFTVEGRPEEGRPGFYQPLRMKADYLVASVEDFEKSVPEPTAEEIEARYKTSYPQPLPPKEGAETGPALPTSPKLEVPAEGPPKTEDAPKADAPKGDAPAKEAAPEAKPAESTTPAAEPAKPETKPEAPAPEKPADEKAPEAPKSSAVERQDGTVEVALVDEPAKKDDAAPAEKAATDKPAADAPAAEKKPEAPAEGAKPDEAKKDAAAEKPAEKPADPPAAAPAGDDATPPPPALPKGIGDNDPAPPSTKVPPLDDDLRQTLKEQIIRERADALAKARCEEAARLVQDVLVRARAPKVAPRPGEAAPGPHPEDVDPNRLTPEQAKAEIEKIAKSLNLQFVQTPLQSPQDIMNSKDHPFKNARISGANWRGAGELLQALFGQGSPLNSPVHGMNAEAGLEMVVWKTEESAPHEPKSLEEIKDQVVSTWKSLQARKVAEKRAEELLKKVRESGKPLGEALQDETVTGQKDTLLLDVKPTGSFAWMTYFAFFQMPPQISTVAGIDKPGESFMKTVFDDIKVGGTGVAANGDKSVYYLVQIENRDGSKPEEMEKLRERFVQDSRQGNDARMMAQQLSSSFQGNPVAQLLTGDAELVQE